MRPEESDQARLWDIIPWREIIQQRNVIAHGYFFLEHDRLWRVATVEVPHLVERVAPLVSEPPPDPETEDQDTRP